MAGLMERRFTSLRGYGRENTGNRRSRRRDIGEGEGKGTKESERRRRSDRIQGKEEG